MGDGDGGGGEGVFTVCNTSEKKNDTSIFCVPRMGRRTLGVRSF